MDIQLTLAAIERFEDQAGVGLLSLVDGSSSRAIKELWTVKRLRLLAECASPPGTAVADIDEWLSLPNLIESQMSAIMQIITQLTPPVETDEYLKTDTAEDSEGDSGNSVSGAG